jgi:hypothetical protein
MQFAGKIATLLAVLILSSGAVSAQQAEFSIREDTCNDREEPFFSLHDKEGGNVGEPGYFKWQVCGDGVEEVTIQDECSSNMNSIVSMYQRNDSHVSVYDNYKLQVCASFTASINNSCQPENRIISMAKEDNSHAAAPGEMANTLCASEKGIESITLEMSLADGNDVYVDDETAVEQLYTASDLDYPYIVTDDPAGIVGYSSLRSIEYSSTANRDIFRVTQNGGRFIVPNTMESYSDIEDEEETITNREFLQQLRPSFSFFQPETPTIRVILRPNKTVRGFDHELRNFVELRSSYRVDNRTEPVVNLNPN